MLILKWAQLWIISFEKLFFYKLIKLVLTNFKTFFNNTNKKTSVCTYYHDFHLETSQQFHPSSDRTSPTPTLRFFHQSSLYSHNRVEPSVNFTSFHCEGDLDSIRRNRTLLVEFHTPFISYIHPIRFASLELSSCGHIYIYIVLIIFTSIHTSLIIFLGTLLCL